MTQKAARQQAEALIRKAGAAHKQAKMVKAGSYVVFEPDMAELSPRPSN